MKKTTIKHPATKPINSKSFDSKPKDRPFFLDVIFNNYWKYRNHQRYVHTDLL